MTFSVEFYVLEILPRDLLCHPDPLAGKRTKFIQSWGPLPAAPKWLGSCPRLGHPSGRQGGQRGCCEALPFVLTPRAWRGRMTFSAVASELTLEATRQIHAFHKLGRF